MVVEVRDGAVALDRTAFYPTGGGQPHDTGTLGGLAVVDVRKDGDDVWHSLNGDTLPRSARRCTASSTGRAAIDLMRTHSALHVLCGVIWNEWRVPVTGGNMEPLVLAWTSSSTRCQKASDARVEKLVNDELAADRPIEVTFLPRSTAVMDEDLIRTKVD